MNEATGTNGGAIFLILGVLRSGKTALPAECRRIAEAKQWQTARIKSRAFWHTNVLLQRAAITHFLNLIRAKTDFVWNDLVKTITVHLKDQGKTETVVQTALRREILDMRKGVCLFRSHSCVAGSRTSMAVAERFPHNRRGHNLRWIPDWCAETRDRS